MVGWGDFSTQPPFKWWGGVIFFHYHFLNGGVGWFFFTTTFWMVGWGDFYHYWPPHHYAVVGWKWWGDFTSLAGAVLPSFSFEDDRKFPALLRKPNLSLIFFRKILKIGFSDFVFLKTALWKRALRFFIRNLKNKIPAFQSCEPVFIKTTDQSSLKFVFLWVWKFIKIVK